AASSSRSFDHLVGERDQLVRNSETQRSRGLEINHELEFGRLLHWKISRLGAPEDFVHVAGSAPIEVSESRPIGHEPAGCGKFSNSIKRRQLLPQWQDLNA